MKGLSIGRAELVSRFVCKERQRLSRATESSLFAAEVQQQSRLLLGGLSQTKQPAGNVYGTSQNLSILKRELPHRSQKVLGGQTGEKPHMEIADPLLVQEILALFHVSADQTKRAATLTGDQGALSLEEFVAMLQRSHEDSLTDFGQEQLSFDDFQKLLKAIRWSDTKDQVVSKPNEREGSSSYDRYQLINTLKNLLAVAEAPSDSLESHKTATTPFETVDATAPADTFGPEGMFDAIQEDFTGPWEHSPFSVWQGSQNQGGTQEPDSKASLASKKDEMKETPVGETNSSENSAILEAQRAETLEAPNEDAPPLDLLQLPSSASANGIPQKTELASFHQNVSQSWTGSFSNEIGQTGPKGLHEPGASLMEDTSVFSSLSPSRDSQAHGQNFSEKPTGLTFDPTYRQGSQPAAWSLISSESVGESMENPSLFSDSLLTDTAKDLSQAKLAVTSKDSSTLDSSAGDSSSFNNQPPPSQDGFVNTSARESFWGPASASISPSSPAQNKAAENLATLSLVQPEWPHELGRKLAALSRSGKSVLTLELQPESLGRLVLRVETQGNQVSALVQTEHPEVRHILHSNSALLRDVLAKEGLQLTHFSVDVHQGNGTLAHEQSAHWLLNTTPAPMVASSSEEPDKTVNTLHVLDSVLGGTLSVRV
ncbi:MAG: flagellar hook-length control protein FliK [Desulfosoma sp.]